MGQGILTEDQKITLQAVAAHVRIAELFYLTGGTALAEFYFGHRYSDDLDFFTDADQFPQLEVEAAIADFKKSLRADSVTYRKLYDRRIYFLAQGDHELKLEFTQYPFPRLAPLREERGILVDSLEDIAANKFMAFLDRIEAKDFVDLYFIITEGNMTLRDIAILAERKFEVKTDALTLGSELSKIRAISALPKMIKRLTIEDLKKFFTAEAKKLKPEILE